MLRVGRSSCGFALNEESFQELSAAGIQEIEISLSYNKYADLNYPAVKALADQYGINLWSYHLPFGGLNAMDIASKDEDMRKRSVACWGELIKKGAEIGIQKFIAHPSSEPKAENEDERKRELDQSMRSLQTLAEIAGANGGVIAVENLPRTCLGRTSDEMLLLTSADSRLKICFDTNHLLAEDLYGFLDRIADKIVTLHISDYDFVNERHWLPGEGKVDWKRLYTKLLQSGYNGVWMYEVGSKCPKTIIRDRNLTSADFARNAYEIFNNENLTVMGTPKENLGMWE